MRVQALFRMTCPLAVRLKREKMRPASRETEEKATTVAAMKMRPNCRHCMPMLPLEGSQNCGSRARKNMVTLGLVMFIDYAAPIQCKVARKVRGPSLMLHCSCLPRKPGKVEKVDGASTLYESEGQGRGLDEGGNAKGDKGCVHAKASHKACHGGKACPCSVHCGLGQHKDDVRPRSVA